MICPFCSKKLKYNLKHSIVPWFKIYHCKNCIKNNKTYFKLLLDTETKLIIYHLIRIDDYFIYVNFGNSKLLEKKYTAIYKNIGNANDISPFSTIKPIFEVADVIDFDFSDLDKLKNKLLTYTNLY